MEPMQVNLAVCNRWVTERIASTGVLVLSSGDVSRSAAISSRRPP